jgi:hypothetical protein
MYNGTPIEEAKIRYKHTRAWFERCIDISVFELISVVEGTRKYLKRSQVEVYMRAHQEDDGQ